MKKKVMLLGAGSAQMPFLNICHDKGFYVIVVSIKGDYPCFKKADKSYYVDTRNKEKILEIAKDENIDAILTDQTDVSVPTVAYVAEKMGLRGIGYETSLKFTNKYLMRKAALAAQVAVPNFDKAENLEDAKIISEKIGYPVVIKPVDSSGSKGVRRIDSKKDLILHFDDTKNFSAVGEVIIEQFIHGQEYVVNGYAMDGKYWNLDIGTQTLFNRSNHLIESSTVFSSAKRITGGIAKKVLDTNSRFVECSGLEFGITHGEYMYNEIDGKVYLVEIAARGGGIFISSDLTPLATGFNTNEAVIDYVVNNKKTYVDTEALEKKVSAWLCFGFSDYGEISDISGLKELHNLNGVNKVVVDDIHVGDKVKKLNSCTDRYGPILIQANSESECHEIIDRVKATLNIKIITPNGIESQIW